MKLTLLNAALLLLALLSASSCKEPAPTERKVEPPPQPPRTVSLTVADVSATELRLKLSMPDTLSGRNFTLLRNGETVRSGTLWGKDTLLLETGLQPNSAYTYQAKRLGANGGGLTTTDSNSVSLATADTSSHTFTWTTELLGDDNANSYLDDCFILNDSCMYAVGELRLKDSTGNIDVQTYAVVKWNGQCWNPKKLFYQNQNGTFLISNLRGVLAFSSADVWLVAGSVWKWDGVSTHAVLSMNRLQLLQPEQTIEKLWGTSNTNLYGVGNKGAIVHYNGVQWTRMESGTTVDLWDIHGSPNGSQIWACGYDNTGGSVILKLQNGQWRTVWDRFTSPPTARFRGSMTGLHVISNEVVVIGDSVYRQSFIDTSLVTADSLSFVWFPRAGVAGSGDNSLAVAGDFGSLRHWNGASWKLYDQFLNQGGQGQDYGIDVSAHQIIVVGGRNTQFPYRNGYILRGTR